MLSCWQLRLLLIGVPCLEIQKQTDDDLLREGEDTHIKSDTGAAWSAPIKKLFSLLPISLVFRLRRFSSADNGSWGGTWTKGDREREGRERERQPATEGAKNAKLSE